MKQLSFFILFLVLSYQSFAQPIAWSSPIVVYTGAGGNLHPRLALNRSGNPYIIWGRTDTRVYFSKWNGTAFTPPIVPSGSLTVFAQSWAGPDIAAFGDTVYISMKVTPENINTNYSYLSHSYNGGSTFSTPVRVDNIDTNLSRFPIVTTNDVGSPLVAFMKFNASFNNPHYVVAKSNDFGMTFLPDVLASGVPGKVCECCPSDLLSSGSNTIMLFRNNLSNIRDIWAGVSADSGNTFINWMRVDNTNWYITSCPASGPSGVTIGDSIYTTFMSDASGTSLVYFNRGNFSTLSSSITAITGTFAGLSLQNYPRIANAGNAAAIVWKQSTATNNTIAFSFTNNIATGFAGYTNIVTGSGIMNADIKMEPGVIHIVWEDDSSNNVMYMKGTFTTSIITTKKTMQEVDVFPNPVKDNFSFNVGNLKSINYCYLIDIAGKHIPVFPVIRDGIANVSIVGFPKGEYYLEIKTNDGVVNYSKIIIY